LYKSVDENKNINIMFGIRLFGKKQRPKSQLNMAKGIIFSASQTLPSLSSSLESTITINKGAVGWSP